MAEQPADATLSEDGQWWWDGADWQPVESAAASSPSDGQLSEDGQWRWDGAEWQPVADAASSDLEQTMDWEQFPELGRMLHYGEDVDAYLTDLGVDPTLIDDDEPNA